MFFLYDAAQFGIDWQSYDPDIIPVGSAEYEWVQAKMASLTEKYNAAKAAGQKVYFMMDMIVFPNGIKTLYGDEILTDGKIDIDRPKSQELIASMFQQMFEQYPQIDGIYIRTGETYVGSGYGTEPDNSAPYYFGNNPVNGVVDKHLTLLRLLRENVCEKGKDVVYRTWGFDDFQKTKEGYLAVADKVEPHEHLYFAIKHTSGDFWRNRDFNQAIGAGHHKQIVEVQCAREYEGKGAFPNYIAGGVIDGFEEYAWQMDADQNQGLRDVVGTEDSVVKGVWTWSRGGGWDGPYINGTENPEGEELWADVNAYVVQSWAQDTSATDEELVLRYARTVLGMDEADARSFYQICKKSSYAVLLGIGIDHDASWEAMWTRDDTVIAKTFQNNVNRIYNAGRQDGTYTKLDELERSVALWQEMLALAEGLDDRVAYKEYIVTTVRYGLYFFSLAERMYTGAVRSLETQNQVQNQYAQVQQAFADYDRLWTQWEQLKAEHPECPTLYEKSGFEGAIAPYRYQLTAPVSFSLAVGESCAVNPTANPYGLYDLVYASSDPTVAQVDAEGEILGLSPGRTLIETATRDGLLRTATMVYVGETSETSKIYADDFEDDEAGASPGWTSNITHESNTFTVERTDGGQAAQLKQTAPIGGGTNVYYQMPFTPQSQKVTVELDMMCTDKSSAFFFVCDSSGKIITQIDFRNNGVLGINKGSIIQVGEYNTNEWYHIKIDCDVQAGTYDLSVNHAPAVTYTFREAAADVGLLQVGINRSYSNTVYYDNLQVYRQEEREVTARDVAQAVVSCPTVANTDETLPLPGVPAGFTIALKSSSSDAVALDGQLNRQEDAQQVLLEFTVTKTADGTTADTAKLPVSIPGTYWLELPAAYGILPGQTIQLYPSVSPYTADDLLYESSDSAVAAVQAAGAVTGVEEGVARITVSTRDRRLQTAVMIYVGEENPVFEEDFASYRDGQRLEWERNIEEPRSTITVVSLERNQVLKLYQPVIGGSTSAYHIKTFAPQTGKVSVSVDMMLESLNSAYFFLCDSTGKIIGQVYCMDSGIYMDVGGRLVRIYEGTYHAGQWYHFTFHCDTEAAAYTVQVDEQAPVSLSFREPASNVGMIMLGINRTAENTVYFDNIKVTSQEKTDVTAAEVAGTINEAPAIRSGDTRLTMPAVPKGFSIRLKSSTSQAVALDGTLTMGEEPQTAALVFTLTRLSDQSQADTAPVTVTVPALQSRPFIVQVQTPAEITVPCGTPFAELPLPDTLSVTWSDGASSRLAVTWSADGYRPEQEESYILSGVLKASDEENPNGLSAKIRVTVSGTDESQTLAQARAAAMSVLAAFKPSNDTTAEEILDAVKAVVVNEGIIIRWDDPFTLAPADVTQNGSITGSLTLTLNGESQTVDVDLVIPVILIKGDVTGDGRVSIEDVMAACRILARKNTGSLPNDNEIARADLTGDDKVTIEDIMAICRVLASNA